jgi:sugar phosphate isomerase/epimerase
VIDVQPLDFVELAASAGARHISLFTYVPQMVMPGQKAQLVFPLVTPEMKGEMRSRLAAHGLSVASAEFFPITPDVDLGAYAPALALGRELGATRAVTHIHDLETARAIDRLGALCDMAAAEGFALAIEFTPMTRGCTTIQRAAWFVDQVGRANLGLGVDCLHLVRGGGTPADVAALDGRYLFYGQVCDGHGLHTSSDYMVEGRNRELPGLGDFPMNAILSALPATAPLEVEIPSAQRREAGVSALDHAREALARTEALAAELRPTR